MKYFPGEDNNWNVENRYAIGYCHGLGLDVGAGQRTPMVHTITNDMFTPADFKYGADKFPKDWKDTFDYVYSSHILEHLTDTIASFKEWIRITKIGGYIVIISPDKNFTPNLDTVYVDSQHKVDYSYKDMREIVRMLTGVEQVNKNIQALPNFSFMMVLRRVK